MLAVERWSIYYADGSTFTSDDGTWAEAPPFGVICIVYYRPGNVLFQEVGQDVSIYEWPGDQPTGVAVVERTPEGMDRPIKMGLWTDGESYWRVHDYAQREVTP